MSALVIGYARPSLFGDGAEAQRAALVALGAEPDRVHVARRGVGAGRAALVGGAQPAHGVSRTTVDRTLRRAEQAPAQRPLSTD